MKVFKALSQDEFKKSLIKALKFYRDTNYKLPDKILVGDIFLPRILTPEGEVIDLNERYKDCTVLVSHIGRQPYIPYIASKGEVGDAGPRLYIHFTDHPIELVCDPEDSRRIFLMHDGKMKMTERGLVH